MEEVVIVGAGIAGLATSLGLHRLGIRSVVVESSESLRTSGFALGIWANGWKALDAIGVGHILRAKHLKLTGVVTTSVNSGIETSELPFRAIDSQDDLELRWVNRRVLLETLKNELPEGTIRYSSKVVHIQSDDRVKSIHLADGTVLKTKVLIGCDGANSEVSKFLGFSKPSYAGRTAIRAFVKFEDGHGFEPKLMQFFGNGVRFGVIPFEYGVYWFFTFTPSPSSQEKEMVEDQAKLKPLILSKLGKVSDKIRQVFEETEVESMLCAELRFRYPWEMLWGNISKDNVCVLGDALHPMTPDIAQGGCSALEDSVTLARALGEALKRDDGEDEQGRIQKALEKMGTERRWRSFDLICTSYFVGFMHQSDGALMQFLRDKLMSRFLFRLKLNKSSFDCGNLTGS